MSGVYYKEREVSLYTLKGENLEVGITDLGACIQFIRFKDKNKLMRELSLLFSTPQQRIDSGTYCGAVIGRVANRIAGAEFLLNGVKYKLIANEGNNTLHGGEEGFDRRFFAVNYDNNVAIMQLVSDDGDQGFPGKINVTVTYQIKGNSLKVKFHAVNCSDIDTVFAPTSHPYFNFKMGRDVLDTHLQINADYFTPIDKNGIPTGEILPVKGTPFDFTNFKKIGQDIDLHDQQLILARGYDHNYILKSEHAATAIYDEIRMDIFTDMPGLQFYSGNYLNVTNNFREYHAREGFALEPQFFPNAINETKFKSPILKAHSDVKYYIAYTFSNI